MSDNNTLSIFICYASEDLARAAELVKFIEGHGVDCWYAERNTHSVCDIPGHNFTEVGIVLRTNPTSENRR
jgi:hypothetical protein